MGKGTQVNIINGTPYAWTRTSNNSYQMNSWSPPSSIPANSSANFYVEWDYEIFHTVTDDSANTQYSISGTTSSFTIEARYDGGGPEIALHLTGMSTMTDAAGTTINLGFTWNEVPYPRYNAMTIIVAGTNGRFVCNSTSLLNQDWLQQNLPNWGSLNLRQLCLPASHDSGMSTIGASTAFANAANCKTQSNDIAMQLGYGVRLFDVRPVVSSGDYYTGHYSNTGSSVISWQGANGQKITDIVKQINDFTQNNAELIVLELSHAYDTDNGYTDFSQDQWNGVFAQLAQLNHLFFAPPGTSDLTRLTLNTFIGGGQAAVVIFVSFNRGALTLGNRAGSGFYYQSQFPIFDQWADTEDPKTLINDQFDKLQKQRASGNTEVFSLDWNLTLQGVDNVLGSILKLAKVMNPYLAPTVAQKCTPSMYPNLLSLDNVVDTTGLVVATAVNDLAATAHPLPAAATAKISQIEAAKLSPFETVTIQTVEVSPEDD